MRRSAGRLCSFGRHGCSLLTSMTIGGGRHETKKIRRIPSSPYSFGDQISGTRCIKLVLAPSQVTTIEGGEGMQVMS